METGRCHLPGAAFVLGHCCAGGRQPYSLLKAQLDLHQLSRSYLWALMSCNLRPLPLGASYSGEHPELHTTTSSPARKRFSLSSTRGTRTTAGFLIFIWEIRFKKYRFYFAEKMQESFRDRAHFYQQDSKTLLRSYFIVFLHVLGPMVSMLKHGGLDNMCFLHFYWSEKKITLPKIHQG